jgi:hypothetical protein
MCRLSGILGASAPWHPRGPVQACNGIALHFSRVFGEGRTVVILSTVRVVVFNANFRLRVLAVTVILSSSVRCWVEW